MESRELQQHNKILCHLAGMPKKILSLYGWNNVPEFVLYDLCQEQCFNLSKAAYFVDNPDFNCLKGLAGFSSQEPFAHAQDIWKKPRDFSTYMQDAPFNRQVKSIAKCSIKKGAQQEGDIVQELAHELNISNVGYCSWHMKNDNHGLLLFQKGSDGSVDKYVEDGVSLFGFCPIH